MTHEELADPQTPGDNFDITSSTSTYSDTSSTDSGPTPGLASVIVSLLLVFGTVLYFSFSSPAPSPRPGQLDPQWFGTWESLEGDKIVTLSHESLIGHEAWSNDGKREWIDYKLDWHNGADLQEAKFGYSGAQTSPPDLTIRLEHAIRRQEANTPDFSVRNPGAARHAVAAISAGRYKVVRGYSGGDCAIWEYIVDRDRLLEVSECKYHFNVRLFRRVR